jgi:hypothetical protein
MRTPIALLFAVSAAASVACSPPPDAPEPLPVVVSSANGTAITGSIVDGTGVCIEDAIAEIVAGPAAGTRTPQATPCDSWSDLPGFTFRNLAIGDKPTIRASAPGYVSQERAVPATWPSVAYASFELLREDSK